MADVNTSAPANVALYTEDGRQFGTAENPVLTDPARERRTLTERMFAKAPLPGYRIFTDLADPLYIYLAEAPVGSAETDAVFSGVRMPLTVGGEVRERIGFAWATRGVGW